MKTMKVKRIVFYLGIIVASLTACSEENPKKLTDLEEAKARLAKIESKYQKPNKESKETNSEMPKWFPKGFPYPSQTVVRFHSRNAYGGTINLTSDLSIDPEFKQ